MQSPPGVKDDEGGADFSMSQGKTSLLPLGRKRSADNHAGVPCLNSQTTYCKSLIAHASNGVTRCRT